MKKSNKSLFVSDLAITISSVFVSLIIANLYDNLFLNMNYDFL
ncbi:MAG TPA: hypothetical protein VIR55_14115 [Ignavibacteria bacterium]